MCSITITKIYISFYFRKRKQYYRELDICNQSGQYTNGRSAITYQEPTGRNAVPGWDLLGRTTFPKARMDPTGRTAATSPDPTGGSAVPGLDPTG